jgi:hypothetical protein
MGTMNCKVSLKLFREIENGRWGCDDLGDSAVAPTGDAYVNISGRGGFGEALKAFNEYAQGREGTIYWRVLPELRSSSGYGEFFYMRLFIAERD